MKVLSRGENISLQLAQDVALFEAKRGAGWVSPNPLVGCVIVDSEHRFLSSGYHAVLGGPHAERDAFAKLSAADLEGSTVYVTLEPCSHQGRTPPCTELFVDRKIRKVVVGLQDPNPLVAGRGIEFLKQQSIEVVMEKNFTKKCEQLTEMFLWHIQNKTPFVTLKVALSADGKVAGLAGTSPFITSEEARLRARELRATYDATFIGAETFLRDNPLLDFRQTRWEKKKEPKVVILDPRGRAQQFFPQSRMATVIKKENVTFVCKVDEEMLKNLYGTGIYSLYVEGGTKTHSLFIDSDLFQKILCFSSPKSRGEGVPWVWTEQQILEQLNLVKTTQVGEDQLREFAPR